MGSAGGYAVGQLYIQADAYLDRKTSPVNLPTPLPSVEWKADMSEAYIKVQTAAYTGFGNVILVAKKDAEPSSSTDGSAISSGSLIVTENGTYYVRAFPGTDSVFLSSDSYKIEVSGVVTARIWAVQWNYGSPSPALTRLTPSTDPLGLVTETISTEPVPAIPGESGSSPFDAYNPWSGMKRRNFDANGAPSYWEDESGFSTSSYDTMVWIPEFWIKVVDDPSSSLRTYYLADSTVEGFTLHPGSGQYVGAYPTSNSKESKSGKTRQGSQSIVTMRTNARTKGSGWGLIDIAERNAIEFLYIIEFANWNSQNMIGDGPTSDYATGYTDSMTYHTGKGTNNAIKYRHIEGLWRSQYEWTDGFNTVAGHHYVSTDRDNYQSDVTTGYTEVGSGEFTEYPIKELLYNESVPWLIGMPKPNGDTGGSYTTYVCDYGYLHGSATYVLGCGGNWVDGTYAGLFYFLASVSSSYTRSSRGSRLSYKAS